MTPLLVAALVAAMPVQVAHRRVVTDDGASLALHRFTPPGGGASRPPALVVTDAGFGRALAEPLARWLAARGRAVYVAELRGQGAADQGHSLRTVVHLDLPAVARALAAERSGPVDLIAHGWVGTLALAATTKELQVRRVIALATPVAPEPPTALAAQFLKGGGRASALTADPGSFEAFTQLFAMGGRFGRRELEAVATTGARDLSPGVAAELLTWMETGDLALDDGTSVGSRLRRFDRPTLLFLALADAWAPPESCAPLRELAKGPVRLRMFSRATDGDDYAHVTLFHGQYAARQVFRQAEAFLEAAP